MPHFFPPDLLLRPTTFPFIVPRLLSLTGWYRHSLPPRIPSQLSAPRHCALSPLCFAVRRLLPLASRRAITSGPTDYPLQRASAAGRPSFPQAAPCP